MKLRFGNKEDRGRQQITENAIANCNAWVIFAIYIETSSLSLSLSLRLAEEEKEEEEEDGKAATFHRTEKRRSQWQEQSRGAIRMAEKKRGKRIVFFSLLMFVHDQQQQQRRQFN